MVARDPGQHGAQTATRGERNTERTEGSVFGVAHQREPDRRIAGAHARLFEQGTGHRDVDSQVRAH